MENILIGYGQTELSPINNMTLPGDSLEKRTGTVGRAVPWVEVRISDENGIVVPVGEKGEICTRGYSVMRGYWNDDERTAETIDPAGWLSSGDLGIMDAEGYVKITGRLKEMIIRGGENIYPREIEDFIFTHPKVAAIAVFGIPDDYFGEEIMAWIQLHEGTTATEDEIRAFCEDRIAHFKIPKYICFVDEFPMTVTGKLQKFRMREIALEKLDLATQQADTHS